MNKYIFISLLFMGWGFWELSGGADFRPSQPFQKKEQVSTIPVIELQPPIKSERTNVAPLPAVVRVAQQGDQTVQPLPTSADPTPDARNTATPQHAVASLVNIQPNGRQAFQTPESAALTFSNFAASTPTTPADGAANVAERQPEASIADLREVRGTRVNMRGGPGTSYGVLGVLVQGQQVEVLRANGAGWVKLRDKDSGRVGWMAAKMLQAAAN